MVQSLLNTALGSDFVRKRCLAPEIYQAENFSSTLESIEEKWPSLAQLPTPTDSPIFIISAGWGTGSTLLQRLVSSSKQAVLWGEPLDQGAPIQRLQNMLRPIREDWPPKSHQSEEFKLEDLPKTWTANFDPPVAQLATAHRAFISSWLDTKSFDSQLRWGLKEVRLTISNAQYLKWLFPNAKFLFLYRDLFNSYRSCRRMDWISVWPNYKVSPIVSFASHWRFLLEGFLQHHESVDGRMVCYEDLVARKIDFFDLADYLELESMDLSVLDVVIGNRSKKKSPLIYPEKLVLNAVAGDLRESLGYKD